MISPPIIIRASSLAGYPDCPRRTAARTVSTMLKDAGYVINSLPPSIGAAVGSGTHAGAAYMLTEKMATGSLGNQTEAEERAVDELERRISEDGVLFDDTTPNMGTAQQQTARMVNAYRFFVAPSLEPIAVEERIEAEIVPGFILSGACDVLDQDVLHDTKSGSSKRAYGAQYGAYTLLRRTPRPAMGYPNGQPVNGIVEDFIQRASLKKTQPDPERIAYPLEVNERLAWSIMRRMVADISAFQENGDIDAFIPNPASSLCSGKYCPLHGTTSCRAHKGAA